jgi:hypothetical protein
MTKCQPTPPRFVVFMKKAITPPAEPFQTKTPPQAEVIKKQ